MSKKETERRTIASTVMRMAHELWRKGLRLVSSWSSLLRLCWGVIRNHIRNQSVYAKGVTYPNIDGTSRQKLLAMLFEASGRSYWLKVSLEAYNPFDPNAMKVESVFADGTTYQLGYLPKELVKELVLEIRSGKELIITDFAIAKNMGGLYGVKLYYACI